MRIGFITGEYPPMQGGVGAYTRELALALHNLGHQIDILTTGPAAISEAAVAVASVDEDGLSVHRTIPRWDVRCLRQIGQWYQTCAPDVVSLQYEPAAYGMRGAITLLTHVLRHGAPIAVTFHDLLPPYLFPKAGPLRAWAVRQLAGTADGCIVTNGEDEKALAPRLGSDGPAPQLIPIGSNIATVLPRDFTREGTLARHGLGTDDLVVGFFGFTNRSKGIETLLHAVSRLRRAGASVQLLLIGGRTGTSDAANVRYAEEIDALIDELGLASAVHRTGFIDQPDVSAALRAIDVCALPYRDGANLRRGTLHAAMAHGCAIVTTSPPAPSADDIDDAAVWLIPPEDDEALAEAILKLGSDVALRDRLSRGAARLATRFSWPVIAAETARFYETLIAARS